MKLSFLRLHNKTHLEDVLCLCGPFKVCRSFNYTNAINQSETSNLITHQYGRFLGFEALGILTVIHHVKMP